MGLPSFHGPHDAQDLIVFFEKTQNPSEQWDYIYSETY